MATGESLPAISRTRYRPGVRALLWIEVVVVMTDVAEIIGGALALQILFGWPLLLGVVFIAVLAYAVTGLRWHWGRLMASLVLAGMAVIVASVLAPLTSLTLSPVSPPGAPRPTGQGGRHPHTGVRGPACARARRTGPAGIRRGPAEPGRRGGRVDQLDRQRHVTRLGRGYGARPAGSKRRAAPGRGARRGAGGRHTWVGTRIPPSGRRPPARLSPRWR